MTSVAQAEEAPATAPAPLILSSSEDGPAPSPPPRSEDGPAEPPSEQSEATAPATEIAQAGGMPVPPPPLPEGVPPPPPEAEAEAQATAIATATAQAGEESPPASPQVFGMLTGLPPFHLTDVERGMEQFLEEMERTGQGLARRRDGTGPYLWIVAGAAALIACEIAGRQLRRPADAPAVDVARTPGFPPDPLFTG